MATGGWGRAARGGPHWGEIALVRLKGDRIGSGVRAVSDVVNRCGLAGPINTIIVARRLQLSRFAGIVGCYRQFAFERQNQAMANWNYRVVEPPGRPEHFIAEVLYESTN